MISDTPKFIDFIGVDKFDSIVSSYLVNLYNYMKTKEKEIQVDLFIPLMSCKYRKKIKGLKAFKVYVYLERKILGLKDRHEDEFVSSEGV